MREKIFVSVFINIFLFFANSEHHYHIESILSPEEIKRIITENGGIIMTELEFTGRTSYHVEFAEILQPLTRQEKLLWWRLRGRQMKQPASIRVDRHPAIHLTYQQKLRVDKRTKYDCTLVPHFGTTIASATVEVARLFSEPPQEKTALDHSFLELIYRVRNITRFNDIGAPYAKQYINDGTGVSPIIGYDINIYPAYALGFTGKGVKVLILDDAVDMDHCDIADNFNAEISTNLVDSINGSKAPVPPEATISANDSHGTQCAGLVAGIANNSICSHGVAYHATVGGVRLLGNVVTDSLEAAAFSYKSELVDIYCASWGPTDNGMTMDKPRQFTLQKIKDGWKNGRKGMGSIFVFASGNGGGDQNDDNCGADGFVGRPEVISVGALDELGNKAKYAESCASLHCSVPVGGIDSRGDILPSTSPNSECLINFAGTSAAAPLAAGCFALALQANPKLTPRDLEHLIVWGTRMPNNKDQHWYVNAAGILHSINVGFGLLDCARIAFLARNWTSVGPLCSVTSKSGVMRNTANWASLQASIPGDKNFHKVNRVVDAKEFLKPFKEKKAEYLIKLRKGFQSIVSMETHRIKGSTYNVDKPEDCNVEVLEKVVVHIQWKLLCRGTMNIWLISPAGTKTKLLSSRKKDIYNGPSEMTFTSVAHWGEPVPGKWSLEFMLDTCSNPVVDQLDEDLRGVVYYVGWEFLGTTEQQSGFGLNKKHVESFITPIGQTARDSTKGAKLTVEEIARTYDFQRETALRFTENALGIVRKDHSTY